MNRYALTIVAASLLVLFVANRRGVLADALAPDDVVPLDEPQPDGTAAEQGQGGGAVDAVLSSLDPFTYWPAMTDDDTAARNLDAFLFMIRRAEGTAGEDGFRTMFGYRKFSDYTDHPRSPAKFFDKKTQQWLWSSAAGAWQFMAVSRIPGGTSSTRVDTWDRLKRKLDLPDFTPESQRLAAIELISEQGALADVQAGRFDTAVEKVRRVWASLPGAGYGQPERSLATLRTAYTDAGGSLA